MSIIVFNPSFANSMADMMTCYVALIVVMVTTSIIACMTVVAEGWLNRKIPMAFCLITNIILASLSFLYVIDDMSVIRLIAP